MSIRVGVFGAAGKMGRTVCDAVIEDPATELVVAIDPAHEELQLPNAVLTAASAESLVAAGVDVAVDFTHLEAARENLAALADAGIHAVVGTTGFTAADLENLAASFTASGCLVAPNFAIGALLLMRLAAEAAPYFDSAEIIELHHDAKKDAPSGTATLTAERMAAASDDWVDDPTETVVYEGARGGEGPGGIRVHSVRMRGMVAHQEVILGTTGQTLTLRHDSIDRSSFMPGVLLAVKSIADHPGLTVGLDTLLGWD